MLISASVPHAVRSGQPHTVALHSYRIRMTPKDPKRYLWQNIAALMREASPSVDSVRARTKVGRGTVQRIKEGETSVGVDTLQSVAAAFGIEVWQLLVPNIDPDQLPTLNSQLAVQWPFSQDLLLAGLAADPPARRQAENAARACFDMDPLPRVGNTKAA